MDNLTNRLRGSESIAVAVEPRDGATSIAGVVQQRLEQVPGVSRVVPQESRDRRLLFEVESLQGRSIRGDVARAVVDSGWNLTELRPVGLSLEEIFLQLTGTEPGAMSNILIICRKELKSYFASPIAYLLMAFFGLILRATSSTPTRDLRAIAASSPR